MQRYALILMVILLALVATLPTAAAQTPPPTTPTAAPTATPLAATPTVTPVVIEMRQPPQPPKSFWEQYGVITVLVSGIIGGILALIFQNLLGPTFSEWGEALKEKLKGADRRFREKYIPALAEEHRDLKLVGVRGGEGVPHPHLRDVYVTLQMGSLKEAEAALDQSLTIEQTLSRHPRLVILGEPGAGKSTLLDYLTLVFSGNIQAPRLTQLGDLLPIYLLLRNCVSDERPLTDLMAHPDFLPLDLLPPDNFFERQLEKGRCLVLLDGLDEVIDSKERDRAADKINQLARSYPQNRYIVTCRAAGWREGLLTGDFVTLYVRSFNDADIKRFALGWYRAVLRQKARARINLSDQGKRRELDKARSRAKREARALTAALYRNAGLYRLARNPLILSLIALVHYRRTRLPQGRAELYQQCLQILLDTWDSNDKELEIIGPTYRAKEIILREIAYYFHTAGTAEAGREELEKLIKPLIPRLKCPIGAAETLRQIEERSGILVTRAIDRYVFAHRTLQEYLTAVKLSNDKNLELQFFVPHLRDEPWREVILLYAGLVENATSLLRFILSQPDDEEQNMLILAGQCLAEDLQLAEDARAEARNRLEAAFRSPKTAQNPLTFRRLGETLAAIGGSDILAFFANLLAQGEPAQRAAAARALGQVGKTSDPTAAAERLLRHLQPNNEAKITRAVCLSLAELGVKSEPVLAALEKTRREGDEAARGPALWALLELGQAKRFDMVKIPAGDFLMGSDPDADKNAEKDEQPQHRLYLPDYYLGRTPVTNDQYAVFVKATGHAPPKYWKGQKPPGGKGDHPVVEVSWDDAAAYCRWLGAALPSEAQWEKGARGSDGRIYPWDNQWDAELCNTSEGGKGETTPVGAYPKGASPYGLLDMAGNVWEWCATAAPDGDLKPYPYDVEENEWSQDYANRTTVRALRGGPLDHYWDYARCACRDRGSARYGNLDIGFRVLVSPIFSES